MNLKIKFFTMLLLYTLIINFSIAIAKNIDTDTTLYPEILSESAVLMDAELGTVLFDQKMNEKLYPASITKIMTTLLALECGKLDEIITFSRDAVFGIEPNSSHIGIKEGEQLTLEQALYGVMLMSANEVCLGIAEHIDGSTAAFAEHMTKRAAELGAVNTNFTNPNGLHDDNHYTTALDMALITKEAIKNEEFCKIIGTYSYQIPPTNKNPGINYLANQHKMFRTDTKFHYEGVIGGKTGFTDQAKYTLVTIAKRNGITLIASVLKGETMDSRYEDTIRLLDFGFQNFEQKQIFDKSTYIMEIPIQTDDDSQIITDKNVQLYAKENFDALVKKDFNPKDIIQEISTSNIKPPIKKDAQVGTLKFIYEGNELGEVNLYAKNSVDLLEPIEAINLKEATGQFQIYDYIPLILTISVIIGIVTFLVISKLTIGKKKYYNINRKYK